MSTITPPHLELVSESGFQLPVPGLFADLEVGAASVALGDDFLGSPADRRASILQQWVRTLSAQRDATLVEMFHEFARSLFGATIVQQIESFRQRCNAQGIVCPTDFAVLLQRY